MRDKTEPSASAHTPAQTQDLHRATLHLLTLLDSRELEQDLLQEGIETLTALVGTRYGAIALVDADGNNFQFIYSGITPEQAQRIGRPPQGRGLLGTVLGKGETLRLEDIGRDPRAVGFPPHHPPMKSLLAVPVIRDNRLFGRVYLSEKIDGVPFSDSDEALTRQYADALAFTLAYHRTLAENEQEIKILERVAQATASVTDGEFFRELVVHLARTMAMDYAFIGELADNGSAVQTVATCVRGKIADNFVYRLPGTPCADVIGKTTCFHARGVQLLFPEDRLLVDMGVESYIGSPLFDSAGKPLGILVMLDSKPLGHPERAQAILRICAARAAAELERRHASRALRESEKNLRAMAEVSPVGIFRADTAGDCLYVNERWCALAGLTPPQAAGTGWSQALHPEDRESVFALWHEVVSQGQPFLVECRFRRPDGSVSWIFTQAVAERDASGKIIAYVGSVTDITERKQTEKALRENNEILERIFDSTHFCVVYLDRDFNFIRVNRAYANSCGFPPEYFPGKNHFQLYPHAENEAIFRRVVQTGEPYTTTAKPFEFPDHPEWGVTYWDWTVHPLKDNLGNIEALLFVLLDVTERRRAEERLNHLAHYDTLTELPNRLLLQDRLNQAMVEADRHDRLVAVIFLDLDRFKLINDTLGHETGDALLKSVAERLKASVRAGDTISRLGGDEFTIILAGIGHVDDVAHVAHKIIESFIPPFNIDGRELFISPSMGITLYPFDDNDIDSLLRNADAAMYHAKELGRNTFQFYTAELNRRTAKRLRLETALRHAIERHELQLHYQPQLNLKTGRITGAEALLRWNHPEMGLISPLEFIPLAEETGLIIAIGEWVLRSACAQARAWHDRGFGELQIAVNLSGRQFQHHHLARLVKQVLKDAALDPRLLDLELTESLLMHNTEAILGAMDELHAHGVAFSMDDFGTGYSSLSYLKRFPIDTLKIDQTFVRDIPGDPDDAAIARAIISMAHSLGMKVIAEGVETARQLAFLRTNRCDGMQGYYFSKPLSAQAMTRLLQDDRRLKSAPGTARRRSRGGKSRRPAASSKRARPKTR